MAGESVPRSPRRITLGAAIVVVILALVVTVAIGLVRSSAAPTETVRVEGGEAVGSSASVQPATLYVHVAGAVARPGLYRLDEGARVVDAVAAAGGLGDGADAAAINLARPLGDGEQLVVPLLGAAGPVVPGAAAGDGRVNLNTADLAALDTLPRIGPALAQRIVDWRDENGRFTSIEDLLAVPGIGDKMLASIRDLVTL